MSTAAVGVVEPQSIGEYRLALFTELDKRAREIERQIKSTWVELAELCTNVKENELWREGNFSSFESWLKDACPTSRSMAYSVMGIRKELEEIPTDDLRKIPLGNASILRDTPKARRTGHLLEAAKNQPPREFLGTVIQTSPEAHLEAKHCHKFRLTTSQSRVVADGFEMWRILNEDPAAPIEEVLEGIITDYMLSHEREFKGKRP